MTENSFANVMEEMSTYHYSFLMSEKSAILLRPFPKTPLDLFILNFYCALIGDDLEPGKIVITLAHFVLKVNNQSKFTLRTL